VRIGAEGVEEGRPALQAEELEVVALREVALVDHVERVRRHAHVLDVVQDDADVPVRHPLVAGRVRRLRALPRDLGMIGAPVGATDGDAELFLEGIAHRQLVQLAVGSVDERGPVGAELGVLRRELIDGVLGQVRVRRVRRVAGLAVPPLLGMTDVLVRLRLGRRAFGAAPREGEPDQHRRRHPQETTNARARHDADLRAPVSTALHLCGGPVTDPDTSRQPKCRQIGARVGRLPTSEPRFKRGYEHF
jgi:hypothetical protein